MVTMRSVEDLIAEAAVADVDGWSFAPLDGRATEERPSWGYARLLAEAVAGANVAVDLDTGGGEVLSERPTLATHQYVTESWPPNVTRARALLGPRGVQIHQTEPGAPIPLTDDVAEPVLYFPPSGDPGLAGDRPGPRPGGQYLAQHVGPTSAFELIEHFVGPTTTSQSNT